VVKLRPVERWNTKDNLFLLTGGVDTAKFSPAPDAKRPDRDTIIWVGGLLPGKRIDVQLHAFKLVLQEVPAARLVLVGEGNSERELRSLADRLGVSGSVDFLGVRHDVPELLRSASVFLSCSRAEGLPTVVLEAQAAGLPVVASDIEPHREGLAEELHPFLFPVDSPEDAAKSVVRILKDKALREELRRAGREYVLEKYDASKQLALLQDYYTRWTRDEQTEQCSNSIL
jgi:glycosyltransferase involved in cell wall biosynthesis